MPDILPSLLRKIATYDRRCFSIAGASKSSIHFPGVFKLTPTRTESGNLLGPKGSGAISKNGSGMASDIETEILEKPSSLYFVRHAPNRGLIYLTIGKPIKTSGSTIGHLSGTGISSLFISSNPEQPMMCGLRMVKAI